MQVQKCVNYEFSETRTIRTALPFELLTFIINHIEKSAIKKNDIRRLFYVKYGLLLDRIQIHSAFSYLLSKGLIAIRNEEMNCWSENTCQEDVGNRCGHVIFCHPFNKKWKQLKNNLMKEIEKEKSLTNCLSFTYLVRR